MPDARPLKPGDPARLGSHEITGRIGEGGQGVVYLGVTESGDPVAIKLLRADLTHDDTARGRFMRELGAVKRVARFCTAQVIDADVEGDRPYIVSEYVAGPSLHQLVTTESPRTGADLERLAIGTVTALVAIHQAGIVHRDFKPHNVLMAPDGPRVIDFGIAKALDAAATVTNSTIGTPAYMAPEQLSAKEITPAADIFAWGSTMAFAATGRAPFGQDTVMAVIHRIINQPPELGPMEEPLRSIVADCLAKNPADRPLAQPLLMRLLGEEGAAPTAPVPGARPTALLGEGAALAAAPTAVVGGGDGGSTVPATAPPGRWALSGRALVAAFAGLLVAAGVIAGFLWMSARDDNRTAPGGGTAPVQSSPGAPSLRPTTGPTHRRHTSSGKGRPRSTSSHGSGATGTGTPSVTSTLTPPTTPTDPSQGPGEHTTPALPVPT